MSTTVIESEPRVLAEAEPMSANAFSSTLAKWRAFTQGDKQVMALALLASVVACVIVIMLWTASRAYRPLYSHQESIDTAQVIEVLESEAIPYQIDSNSGLVLVIEDQLGAARMLLAAKGVKARVPSGVDELDLSSLGTSQFMEQAKYRHSIEGELARTIMSMKSVRSARVHLAIPKNTLFIRQKRELPSASVMLQLVAGTNLTPSQVEAVINLVTGSVTEMQPGHVKVVDQLGRLLSADVSSNKELSQAGDRQTAYIDDLENKLSQNAGNMLEAILGMDNYKIKVAAKVSFNQVEETTEALSPESVIIQESTRLDNKGGPLAQGIPGALSNKPSQPATDKNTNQFSVREDAKRQFDVGRSVRHVRYQHAQLENLSISVMVNSAVSSELTQSETELAKLAETIKDAVGFNTERGDSFSINAFPFKEVALVEIAPIPWWQSEDYQAYLRFLIGGLLGLGLILFVLRPLVSHLTRVSSLDQESDQFEPEAISSSASSTSSASATPSIARTPQEEADQLLRAMEEGENSASNTDWMTTMELPEAGSPLTVKIEHLGMLANEEPARVAEVLSHWINDRHAE